MKKLIPGILSMLLCLGMATGCDSVQLPGFVNGILGKDTASSESIETESTPDSSTPDDSSEETPALHEHEQDLKDVKEYLQGIVNEMSLESRKEFKLINSYSFFGETAKYDIAWSVNVEGITIVEGETEDTVKIGEFEEDTPFVLTATITDPDGCHTTTATFDGVALKALSCVPELITEKPAENTAYKLYVEQKTLKKDLYFTGKMAATYYFGTSENFEEGVDIYVEYIEGTDNFNLYFMDGDTKTYIGVREAWNSKNSYWTFNIVMDTTAPSSFTWDETLGSITTTVPCRSEADNTNPDATEQPSTKTLYLGNYGTKDTISSSTMDKVNNDDTNLGGLAVMISKDSITPDVKIATELDRLDIATTFIGAESKTLPTAGTVYSDVTITWAVTSGENVTISGGTITSTVPAADTTAVITATLTCGDVTETKEFTISIKSGNDPFAPILNQLYALADGEQVDGEFTLTGKITVLDSYNNPTIVVDGYESMPVYCYKLVVTNAVGEYITVTATSMKNYKGTYEFMNCTLVTEGGDEGEGDAPTDATASISFADTANRTTQTTDVQVWEQNGVTVTNNKAASTSNVADYSNPARFYKNSQLIVEYTGMQKIVFTCNTTDYATTLKNSIPEGDYIVSVSDKAVKVVFTAPVNSFTIEALSAGQVRMDAIDVYDSVSDDELNGGGEVTPPEGGDEGDDTVTLVEGQAYNMYLNQVSLNQTLYLTGEMSSTWFATSDNVANAVSIYAEVANGGYKFYFLDANNAKSYIYLEEYQKSNGYWGAHVSFATEGTVFSYNEAGCWAATLTNDTFFLGTYGTYNTISASASSFMVAANMGVSQFPALFVEVDNTVTPPEGGEVTPPVEETKYTLTMVNGENPRVPGAVTTAEYVAGATLELPVLEAEGKTFKGWYLVDLATGQPSEEAPVTMPAAALTLKAVWEYDIYTLTIVNGETSTEFKFAVEYNGDIMIKVTDLAYVLAKNLPEGYIWLEEVPATFELKNYTFTAHTHAYSETTTTEPTCTEKGLKTFTCSCGDVKTEEIPSTGHSYNEGTCGVCGEEDPNYVPYTTYTMSDVRVLSSPKANEINAYSFVAAEKPAVNSWNYKFTFVEGSGKGVLLNGEKLEGWELKQPGSDLYIGLGREAAIGDVVVFDGTFVNDEAKAKLTFTCTFEWNGEKWIDYVEYTTESIGRMVMHSNGGKANHFYLKRADKGALPLQSWDYLFVVYNRNCVKVNGTPVAMGEMKSTNAGLYVTFPEVAEGDVVTIGGRFRCAAKSLEYIIEESSFKWNGTKWENYTDYEDIATGKMTITNGSDADEIFFLASNELPVSDWESAFSYLSGNGITVNGTMISFVNSVKSVGGNTMYVALGTTATEGTVVKVGGTIRNDQYGVDYVMEECEYVWNGSAWEVKSAEVPHEHTYTTTVTAPTCTAAGYTTYTCDCGNSYKADEVAALGHNYNSEVTVAPTLNSVGTKTFTCANCGDTYTEEIAMLEGAVANVNGYKYATFAEALAAANASDTLTLMADLSASDIITLNKAITLDGADYTLTSTAARAINVDCTGDVVIKNLTIVAGNGCERGINIINQASNVTLDGLKVSFIATAGPLYGAHVATSATGANLTVKNSEISAYGAVAVYGNNHNVIIENSTLVGTNVYSTETNAFMTIALGGDNINVTVNGGVVKAVAQGTMNQFIVGSQTDATTNSTVTINAELVFEGEKVAYNHIDNLDSNVVKFPVAYVDALVAEGFCVEADDTYAVVKAHNYEAVVTAPTCTAAGYTTYTCACGATYTEEGEAAKGHIYDDGVVTAPTCTAAGYTTYTCACGATYTEEGEAAKGHADNDGNYKCDNCSTVMEPADGETLTLAQAIALAKALGTGKYSTNKYYLTVEIVDVYNTTYGNMNVTDADGYDYVIYGLYTWNKAVRYDKMDYKPVAGDELTVYGQVGSYSGSSVSYQMKDAWLDEVVAHEHAYSEVVTAPTCTTDGYTTVTCSICKVSSVKDVVTALGHTTEAGTCERCGQEIGGESNEPAVVATFDFGSNGSAAHVDGNSIGSAKTYTVGTYSLALTGMANVYGPAYDAKGNSCIKLGASSKAGSGSFTVPENVTKVVIYAAKYKTNTTKLTINGTTHTLTKNSNDGAYDAIEVDTTTTKTVTFTTVSGGYRCMVNTVEFWA